MVVLEVKYYPMTDELITGIIGSKIYFINGLRKVID